MIKLIAIDLDGTLLNSEKKIPVENKKAINEAVEAGISVVICTGRPLSGVQPLIKELEMDQHDEYAILNNGCTIVNTHHNDLIYYEFLNIEEVKELQEKCQDFDGVYLTLTLNSGYYVIHDTVPELIAYDASLVYTEAIPITIEELAAKEDDVIFQAMYMGEEDLLNQFQEKYHEDLIKDFSITRSQAYIYEAMPHGATKASGLSHLADKLGLTADNVMALGDADNDLQMLEYAKHSVAMGNATDHIKSICRYETSTNNEAGVAKAIREIALGNEK